MPIQYGGGRTFTPPKPIVREPSQSIPKVGPAWMQNSSYQRPSTPPHAAANPNPSWGAQFGRGVIGALDPRGMPHGVENLLSFMLAPPRSNRYKNARDEYVQFAKAVAQGNPEALGGLSTAAIPLPFAKGMPRTGAASRVANYPTGTAKGPLRSTKPLTVPARSNMGDHGGFGEWLDTIRVAKAAPVEQHLATLPKLGGGGVVPPALDRLLDAEPFGPSRAKAMSEYMHRSQDRRHTTTPDIRIGEHFKLDQSAAKRPFDWDDDPDYMAYLDSIGPDATGAMEARVPNDLPAWLSHMYEQPGGRIPARGTVGENAALMKLVNSKSQMGMSRDRGINWGRHAPHVGQRWLQDMMGRMF